MGNSSKSLKIIISTLSILIISTFVGCVSANNKAQSGTSEPEEIASMEGNSNIIVEQNINEVQQERSTTNSVDDSIKEETNGEPAVPIVEILSISGPKPLHMEPREPVRPVDIQQKYGATTLTPIYGEGWRLQVVSFKGNTATFEVGNTGSTNLVIDNSKMKYILYDAGGNNISGSHIEGGPVTIAPNEVKTVTIKATDSRAVSILLNINGFETFLEDISKGKKIVDNKPYTAPMEDSERRIDTMPEVLRVQSHNVVSGNGKFKYVAEGVQLTENDSIGPLRKSERYPDTMLPLVKVNIANTSNDDMTITEIRESFFLTDASGGMDIPLEAVKALGDSGLPLTIKAGEIAEGYVPFGFLGSEYSHGLAFETTLGPFVFGEIESFQVLKSPQS